MDQFVKKVELSTQTDEVLDNTEAQELDKQLAKILSTDIMDFFAIPENKDKYDNTLLLVKQSLEKFKETNPADFQSIGIEKFIASFEKVNNNVGIKINTEINENENAKILNTLLSKENTTFGKIFEQSSEAVKTNIHGMIHTTLLQDNFLSKNGVLTETWKQIERELLWQITTERANNITFSLLEEIMEKYNTKTSGIKNNKEKMMEENMSLLMNIKNMMKSGWLSDTQKLSWVLGSMDITWSTASQFQNNFTTFLKTKIKDGWFDMTDKKTIKQSIKNWSEYSSTQLLLSSTKRDEALKNTLIPAFTAALENFDNYGNSKNTIHAIVNATAENPFDANNIPNVYGQQNIDDQIPYLMENIAALAKDLPPDPKSPEAKQLKEMMMNKKIDALWDKSPIPKEFAFKILKFLEWLGLQDIVVSLFGKSYGIEKKDMNKLLNRPYIKAWMESYKTWLTEKQDLSKKDSQINTHIQLDPTETWDLQDRDYFRLTNNLVYTNNKDGTTGNNNWQLQKLDDTGKVVDLDLSNSTDQALKKNFEPATAWRIEEFIINDIHKDTLLDSLATVITSKKSIDGKEITESTEEDREIASNLIGFDSEIKNDLQKLMKGNKYIYSTEDLIGLYLEDKLAVYKPTKEVTKKEQVTTTNTVVDKQTTTPATGAGTTVPAETATTNPGTSTTSETKKK